MAPQLRYQFQFGLRTYFVLVTVGIWLVVIGIEVGNEIARRKPPPWQRQAIIALWRSNAHILHQYERGNYPAHLVYYPPPAGMPPIESPVYSVELPSCKDNDLTLCRHLAELEVLDLKGPKLTDNGLKHLESVTSLKRVSLYGTAVSPQGLARLQKALPHCAIVIDGVRFTRESSNQEGSHTE